MNKRNITFIIIFIVLMGAIFYFMNVEKVDEGDNTTEKNGENIKEEVEMTTEVVVGEVAPNFILENLEGDRVSLQDYRGKIVLVNFWATWCKYCDEEMPDLEKFDNENEDLVILAVDVKESRKKVENYINKGEYTFEVLLDETGKVASTYLVNAFPTTYFIDENGILLGAVPGKMTYPQMNQILNQIRENE